MKIELTKNQINGLLVLIGQANIKGKDARVLMGIEDELIKGLGEAAQPPKEGEGA